MSRSKGIHPEGIPLVSTTDRCADLLDLEPDRLARAVQEAGLEPWGNHASGRPVWRWGQLLELARQLGIQPPAVLDPERRRATNPLTVKQRRGRQHQARNQVRKAKR